MEVVVLVLFQLLAYGPAEWCAFVVVALAGGYLWGLRGVLVGQLVVALAVACFDFRWVQAEMSRPGWDASGGPDMDGAFYAGVVIRAVLVNAALLPVNAAGLALARRRADRDKPRFVPARPGLAFVRADLDRMEVIKTERS